MADHEPFKCKFFGCELSFKTQAGVVKHFHSHEYKCRICGEILANKYTLQTHKQTIHNKESSVQSNPCEENPKINEQTMLYRKWPNCGRNKQRHNKADQSNDAIPPSTSTVQKSRQQSMPIPNKHLSKLQRQSTASTDQLTASVSNKDAKQKKINKKMNETLQKIGAENFELKEQIRMRDAQIKERDESIQLLNKRIKHFAAAASFTQRANTELLQTIPGSNERCADVNSVATTPPHSSVDSQTISNTTLLNMKAMDLESVQSSRSSTSTVKHRHSSKPPNITPKSLSENSDNQTNENKPEKEQDSVRYHQCVLCGWSAKAKNRSMSRHYESCHDNYNYIIGVDRKSFFYLLTNNTPHDKWPAWELKPWTSLAVLNGVKGVDNGWLGIIPEKSKEEVTPRASPTSTITKPSEIITSLDEREEKSEENNSHSEEEYESPDEDAIQATVSENVVHHDEGRNAAYTESDAEYDAATNAILECGIRLYSQPMLKTGLYQSFISSSDSEQ